MPFEKQKKEILKASPFFSHRSNRNLNTSGGITEKHKKQNEPGLPQTLSCGGAGYSIRPPGCKKTENSEKNTAKSIDFAVAL